MGRVLQRNDFTKPGIVSYVGGGDTEQNLPASPVQGEVARSKIFQPPLCKGRWHAVPEGLSVEHRTWGMCAFWFVLRGRQSLSQPLRLTAPFTQGSQLSDF